MKVVRVIYTAKPEYVEENIRNIQTVMHDLQELNAAGVSYHCCLGPEGKIFSHTAFFKSDADEQILLTLPAFKKFQEELKANGIEVPPKQENLVLVGSSTKIV